MRIPRSPRARCCERSAPASSTRATRPSPRSSAGIRSSRPGRTASVPLPDTAEEIAEEHERLQEREAAESAKTGAAQWEVRIELDSHEDTEALAERLESEGIPVVRRHTFLLAGAANEDDARALAERLRGEAPDGAKVEVEPGGGMVWEVAPRNPFTFFGGLGG